MKPELLVENNLFSHCEEYEVMITILILNTSLHCAMEEQTDLFFSFIYSKHSCKEDSSIN
jgi:hypothetical protein